MKERKVYEYVSDAAAAAAAASSAAAGAKIMDIAKRHNNKNLENLAIKVSQISEEIKKIIL